MRAEAEPAARQEDSKSAGPLVVGTDPHGTVIEADASQWPTGALAEALGKQLEKVAGPVSVWIDHPCPDSPVPDSSWGELAALGLRFERDLYRMERELPMPPSGIVTRPFVAGQDESAWIDLNNRAFSGHREQGDWTLAQLALRQAEPWFDADGFRLHEIDGRLAAYCWTKVHADEVPPAGEVYVIAVDPQHQGKGLGRALTLAGFEHLSSAGLTRAMLYVDADNTPALTLYRDLGLQVTVTRRLFAGSGTAQAGQDGRGLSHAAGDCGGTAQVDQAGRDGRGE